MTIREIKRVAVIGSGVMGSGIAAHVANAGLPVYLFDLPQGESPEKRNALAEGALARMLKADPAPFVSADRAKLVTPGNLEDDFDKLATCDWIIEVIVEKLEVKQSLYARLEKAIKPTAIVSSNTSTIPLHRLIEGRSDGFVKNFVITHFFNPPRYTRLLELVSGSQTDPETTKIIHDFCDQFLGKGVVFCHDTPGFIGNRIGTFWLLAAIGEAIDAGISVEEADAVFGKSMGMPNTGVFGLLDLVGIDLIPLIGASMRQNLSADDLYHQIYREPDLIKKMIADGYTGRKGKGGFYRLQKNGTQRVKESIDLQTGDYRPSEKVRLACVESAKDNLQKLLTQDDRVSRYAWKVLSQVLSYTASLVPEIADDITAVDTAMRLGYNWKFGPFELIDKLGGQWFAEKLAAEGLPVPALLQKLGSGTFYRLQQGRMEYFAVDGTYQEMLRPGGHLLLSDIKRSGKPIAKNASAALWDIGDGVLCLEFKSKMNSIDPEIMKMIYQAIDIIKEKYKALVIYNEGTNFSAGVNLGLALFVANVGSWPVVENIVAEGQKAYQALKYAPFPVVGAPSGMALGGGCEILLHCDAIQAHVESYLGLVEVGVGVIPAWGGCKEMLLRWLRYKKRPGGMMVAISKVFEYIATAKVAKSAMEAQEMLILREGDSITMNSDRVLADAKAKALKMAETYTPPLNQTFSLPGPTARVALSMAVHGMVVTGKATAYDAIISEKLALVLSGGERDQFDPTSEDDLLTLEREGFMSLIQNEKTLARMEHILETGKPLRN